MLLSRKPEQCIVCGPSTYFSGRMSYLDDSKGRDAAQEGVRTRRDVGAARSQPIRGHVQDVNIAQERINFDGLRLHLTIQ